MRFTNYAQVFKYSPRKAILDFPKEKNNQGLHRVSIKQNCNSKFTEWNMSSGIPVNLPT